MLKHIVLYKLTDNTAENAQKAAELFLSMKGKIPEIVDVAAGADVLHDKRSYDLALVLTVKDTDALARYKSHPYHLSNVKPYIHSIIASSVSVDFIF